MNTKSSTDTETTIENNSWPLGEKIAALLIIAIVIYLIIVR